MTAEHDIYERLKPFITQADELCSCPPGTPIKLMSTGGIGANPIHCLNCNLEVAPGRFDLDGRQVDAVADWLRTYGAIDALELASGAYERWARLQLLDPASPPNVEGRRVAAILNEKERCYFWFWQPSADDDFKPRTSCAVCGGTLARYDGGIFPQLLCEDDSIVLVGR
jgi:hypothetical protein